MALIGQSVVVAATQVSGSDGQMHHVKHRHIPAFSKVGHVRLVDRNQIDPVDGPAWMAHVGAVKQAAGVKRPILRLVKGI